MPGRTWRILIVEDDYFIATELAQGLAAAGMEIVGPAPSLEKALKMLEREQVDGAVLDINLDGEQVYEVADALIVRDLPVVFVTGYERANIPARYQNVPLCLKPVDSAQVVEVLGRTGGP